MASHFPRFLPPYAVLTVLPSIFKSTTHSTSHASVWHHGPIDGTTMLSRLPTLVPFLFLPILQVLAVLPSRCNHITVLPINLASLWHYDSTDGAAMLELLYRLPLVSQSCATVICAPLVPPPAILALPFAECLYVVKMGSPALWRSQHFAGNHRNRSNRNNKSGSYYSCCMLLDSAIWKICFAGVFSAKLRNQCHTTHRRLLQ